VVRAEVKRYCSEGVCRLRGRARFTVAVAMRATHAPPFPVVRGVVNSWCPHRPVRPSSSTAHAAAPPRDGLKPFRTREGVCQRVIHRPRNVGTPWERPYLTWLGSLGRPSLNRTTYRWCPPISRPRLAARPTRNSDTHAHTGALTHSHTRRLAARPTRNPCEMWGHHLYVVLFKHDRQIEPNHVRYGLSHGVPIFRCPAWRPAHP
jgi:hypothetical protein